jgi:site-specific DNA-methyltransferase (cytosine-N4-specific)
MKYGKINPPEKISLEDSLVLEGDAFQALQLLPSNSIQCVITSPPYWGLRDYNIKNQIGLEKTLPEFINRLVAVFNEAKRVLRGDGTLWLNIGDAYTSGNRGYRSSDRKNPARAMTVRPDTPEGLKPKDLIGVPWRLAFALQNDGWYLRSDIIWNKPNAMPESVKDRPTRSHEYIFMLTKSEQYYYNQETTKDIGSNGKLRNRRSVWDINTQPFAGAHFATFPPKLVEPCISLSSKPGDYILDPFFGSGTVGTVSTQLNRRFVGIELNPAYITIALDRLNATESALFKVSI